MVDDVVFGLYISKRTEVKITIIYGIKKVKFFRFIYNIISLCHLEYFDIVYQQLVFKPNLWGIKTAISKLQCPIAPDSGRVGIHPGPSYTRLHTHTSTENITLIKPVDHDNSHFSMF